MMVVLPSSKAKLLPQGGRRRRSRAATSLHEPCGLRIHAGAIHPVTLSLGEDAARR